jgi:plasmid stabilization system protein ParE
VVNVKAVAMQVVSALPDDAGFSDLDEFLYEREMVELGRDDFGVGRTRSLHETIPDVGSSGTQPEAAWSEHAIEAFQEALRTSHSASAEEARDFGATVLAAANSLSSSPDLGRSLPEMGDPSIREVPVRTARIRYRLIYDVVGMGARVLHFTSNITCYRNVRP